MERFEEDFAKFCGAPYSVGVGNGTDALWFALLALGIGPEDEVITVPMTFMATTEAISFCGTKPVFVDIDEETYTMNPALLEKAITPRTKAIIPVHIAGEPCDLAKVHTLAHRHNLHVIEDAAHALPASLEGRRIGAISELTAFSFYATKTITTGEGGMLTTNDDRYAERAAMMRLHGIGKDAWKRYSRSGSWQYEVLRAGYKFNLPDVLAAIGLAQLHKCDRFFEQRCALAQAYKSKLSQIEELELPPQGPENSTHSWHLFIVRLRPHATDLSRDDLIEKLKQAGVGTSVHFIPLHRHPYYREQYHYRPAEFPHAEDAYSRCLSLPIYPGLSEQQVTAVVDAISRVMLEHRRRVTIASA